MLGWPTHKEVPLKLGSRSSLRRSLGTIERAFADIESTLSSLAKRVRRAERQAARRVARGAGRPVRRRVHLSPARRAQLKLQGAYMGFMRQLGPRQKAQVKATKEKKGYVAAIRMARGLAKK
jgi:hypothetical protein